MQFECLDCINRREKISGDGGGDGKVKRKKKKKGN
jgi:hypothetical protein